MKQRFIYTEDFWSIMIGVGLLVAGIIMFLPQKPAGLDNLEKNERLLSTAAEEAPFKTITWYTTFDRLESVKASDTKVGKLLKKVTDKPGDWDFNPLRSFYLSSDAAERIALELKEKVDALSNQTAILMQEAIKAEAAARTAGFKDEGLNIDAERAISQWRKSADELSVQKKKSTPKPTNKIGFLVLLMLIMGILFGVGASFMGQTLSGFLKGFIFIFVIGVISFFLAGQNEVKAIGFGYAAWAILLGLIISNTVGTPKWVAGSLTTELYIKTGLVVLGAEILMGKILAIGLPGIFVAWVVTPVVLITTYWFGQKILKISSRTLNMTISADMSVCGVSAAVATAAACRATKEELTIAIGLSMIFTSVMMIVLPAVINLLGIPEVLGGAWIGGTIDATGAVVAAGAFLGEKALSVAATIKMIQNVLIGLIAFGVAVYFSSLGEGKEKAKFSWAEIWRRFPKFVLGFLGASIVFSIIYEAIGPNHAHTFIDHGVIGGFTKNIRGWLFCLAFVSIGLSINFKDLKQHFTGGKPLLLYVCGQLFNLLLTLGMAYLMFYKVFPGITANI